MCAERAQRSASAQRGPRGPRRSRLAPSAGMGLKDLFAPKPKKTAGAPAGAKADTIAFDQPTTTLPTVVPGEPVIEVAETCRIASEFVRWKRRQQAGGAAAGEAAPIMCACMSPYSSHDPAPADPEFDGLAVAAVRGARRGAAARRWGPELY